MTTSGLFVLFALGAVLSSPLANASPCSTGRSARLSSVPAGFKECGGVSYKLLSFKESFYKAYEACEALGANIATPTSKPQNKCVNNLRGIRTVWLDFNDRKNEGTYVNRQGKSIVFEKWSAEEPNDYGSGEDCATMWNRNPENGEWNDLRCSRTDVHIICQYP